MLLFLCHLESSLPPSPTVEALPFFKNLVNVICSWNFLRFLNFYVIVFLWLSKDVHIFLLALSLFFDGVSYLFKKSLSWYLHHTHTHNFYNNPFNELHDILLTNLLSCTYSINIYWVEFAWQLTSWKGWTVKIWKFFIEGSNLSTALGEFPTLREKSKGNRKSKEMVTCLGHSGNCGRASLEPRSTVA